MAAHSTNKTRESISNSRSSGEIIAGTAVKTLINDQNSEVKIYLEPLIETIKNIIASHSPLFDCVLGINQPSVYSELINVNYIQNSSIH